MSGLPCMEGGFYRRAKEDGKNVRYVLDPKTGEYKSPADAVVAPVPFIEETCKLHRVGRYREAIGVLRDARREHGDGKGAEILSFEEGTLREHDDDAPAMCAFWRGHLGRFPDGAYAAAVRKRIESASCGAR